MKILHLEQGTQKWLEARCGKITASCFNKILTPTGKLSASAEAYMDKVIDERLSGRVEETFQSEAMKRGQKLEPQARLAYELRFGKDIQQVGLILHDIETISCSPDGVVLDGNKVIHGLEIKCLSAPRHIKMLRQQKIPPEYIPQVQGSLWITKAQYWDFWAYHPEHPPFFQRIYPDLEYINKLSKAVLNLEEEIKKNCEIINSYVTTHKVEKVDC